MSQSDITGFQQQGDCWAAQLACGHVVPVRHEPPFNLHPWVLTETGRASRIGVPLRCPACSAPADSRQESSLHAEVLVEQGRGVGRRTTVTRFPAIVGRAEDADVVVEDDPGDPTVSRHHLRLAVVQDRIVASDISMNGTRVENRPLSPDEGVAVGDGTRIWLGPNTRILVAEKRPVAASPSRPAPVLQLQFFGSFRACVLGAAVPQHSWTSGPVLLLAALAETAGQAVEAAALAEALGGHGAGHELQETVSRLRRALRSAPGADALPEPVPHNRDTYLLAWETESDVRQFESRLGEGLQAWAEGQAQRARHGLEQALEVYAGPFLEGYDASWVHDRAAAFDGQVRQALDVLAGLCEQERRLHEALHWRGRLLRLSPAHQPSHVAVLRTMLELGHVDDAVNHYQGALRTLRAQGLEPGTDLLKLGARLER